jgi:hypothetical protein
VSRWWRPVIGLIALGWAFWVVGLVFVVSCEGLQSNPGIAAPGDPCGTLRGFVIVGFVFLLLASILTLARWSDSRRQH